MCDIGGCDLTLHKNNKCILHSDDKNKDIKEFWEKIQKNLKDKYICNKGTQEIDSFEVIYEYIKFPTFQQDNKLKNSQNEEPNNFYFTNYTIVEDGNCSENKQNEYADELINKCNIKFESCDFWDKVKLEKYDFENNLTFINCTFEKEIFLNNNINASIEFRDCDFKNQKFDISNKNFNNTFIFTNCKNVDLISKNNCFKNIASFAHTKFNKSVFNHSVFENMSIFVGVEFLEDIQFEYCIFFNNVFFNEAKIYSKIDLKNAIFKNEVNFLNMTNKNDEDLKSENLENRETARIIKHSFEKLNNIIEANKFYSLEIDKREKELLCGPLTEWIVFFLYKITSNHSQNWLLVLVWIISLSILGVGNNPLDSVSKIFYCTNPLDLISNSFYSIFKFDSSNFTFYQLIIKSFMAYLIYQFIISIRQNTRRK